MSQKDSARPTYWPTRQPFTSMQKNCECAGTTSPTPEDECKWFFTAI